ncbi:hypothetical protein SLUN_05420 [Streptomyces lunaelactis]|uniref:Uncharacterized protein n=1 Tax=Streptomyces lunaelactis TaxID=1535768 RepID=A0A2R4SXW4_9ACTN|nr:hypothetical protein [Streptomyces lunaelactis]AVZ71712.1 hypothetical protein SLUN_05420 [Streptomyces lunaelactis]NUK83087.1 hypothetical protein [Streptomyces lunaelactis]
MRALLGVELPGYRPVDNDVWANNEGDVLSLHFFGLPPDLPASLDDGPALRAALTRLTAQAGGGLIEASVKSLGQLPALKQILKLPLPGQPSGQAFIGSFTVPRATCSTVVKIQSPERGMTGMREAMVMAKVGHDKYFRPHPCAPEVQGGLPFHAADHAQWDAQFPDHPLTKVRRTLDALAEAVQVVPEFAALPPFAP